MKPEVEALREFERKVERASRILYMKLLGQGSSSVNLDQIASDMGYEAASVSVLKAMIGKMVKEGLVSDIERDAMRY